MKLLIFSINRLNTLKIITKVYEVRIGNTQCYSFMTIDAYL